MVIISIVLMNNMKFIIVKVYKDLIWLWIRSFFVLLKVIEVLYKYL